MTFGSSGLVTSGSRRRVTKPVHGSMRSHNPFITLSHESDSLACGWPVCSGYQIVKSSQRCTLDLRWKRAESPFAEALG